MRCFLQEAVAAGLDGMEVLYSEYDKQTTSLSQLLAGEFLLLPSGGSDFHGSNKPSIALGAGKGDLRIPYEYLARLKSRAKPERKEVL